MKKILLTVFFCFLIQIAQAKEVLAPAIQFDIENYKDYFLNTVNYHLDLKSRYDYKITCDADIIGVMWGDSDNIKMFDVLDEYENNNMKSVVMKLKYETYSYVRLYKSSREIVNIIIKVNPLYREDLNVTLGLCELEPYRE